MTTGHRRSIRLRDYHYASGGAYFVTICTYGRQLLFEDSEISTMLRSFWQQIPSHFAHVSVDEFVVMPNHVHGIVFIDVPPVGAQHAAPLRRSNVAPGSLGAIVRSFKSAVTKRLHEHLSNDAPVWQRNYYERVIRNEAELDRVREYIQNNPQQWQLDHENPNRIRDNAYDHDWAWLEGQS